MKLDNINDMVVDYERRTGETVDLSRFKWMDKIGFIDEQNMHLKIVPNGGFFIWAVNEDNGTKYLWLDQLYGVFKLVVPYLKAVMRMNGIDMVITATCRNPKPYIRKWQMSRLPERDYNYENRQYYVLKTCYDYLH